MNLGLRKTLLGLLVLVMGLMTASSADAVTLKTATVGNDTHGTSTQYYRGPVTGYYTSSTNYLARHCMYAVLETQADMQTAGIPAGAVIVDIQVKQKTNHSFSAPGVAKMHLWVKNTTGTTVANSSSVNLRTGMTKVIDDKEWVLNGTGWNSLGNMQEFVYTGDALLVHTALNLNGFSGSASTKPFGSSHTSTTNGPQWAASISPASQALGYEYRGSYSGYNNINNYPYTNTMYGTSSSSTYYYSNQRKTDLRFIYYVPLSVTSLAPKPATGGLPFSHDASAEGGEPPYVWTINRISNANWMNINPGTGEVTGTPPKSLGGNTANFELILTDGNGFGDSKTVGYNLPINAIPAIPYANTFDDQASLSNLIFNYFPSGGTQARTAIHVNGSPTTNGTGLVLDSNDDSGNWPLLPETDAANIATIDDPDLWYPGAASNDPSAYHGSLLLSLEAAGVKDLEINFDLKMVQASTLTGSDRRTNMVIEVSDDLGQTWNRASGAHALPSGLYQGKTAGFVQESVTVNGLSGTQDFVQVRFRWLTRLSSTTGTLKTYIGIDNLVVNSPLAFAAEALPQAQETAPYNQLLVAVGGEPPYTGFALISGALPTGMVLTQDGSEWYLRADAYTIPDNQAGVHNFTLEVTDSTNTKATRQFNLVVAEKPPALQFANLPTLPSAGEGKAYEFVLTASGGVPFAGGKYKWSVVSTNAAWLDFDQNDIYAGKLIGTPPANSAGQQVSLTIRAEDAIGAFVESSSPFTVDIVAEMTILSDAVLKNAPEGDTYRESLLVVGGQPAYQWSFVSGEMPPGLSLRPLTGQITGAAHRDVQGVYNFRLLAVDAGTQMIEKDFTIEIVNSGAAVFSIISSPALPSIGVGNDFKFAIDASGGFPPYTWSVLPGTAPPGMAINADGEIVGVPTAGSAKTYNVDVRITDANNQTDTQTFVIEVLPDIQPVSIVTSPTLPQRREGTFFVQTLSATGGVAPYTWELLNPLMIPANQLLPAGVEFNQAGSSAVISGLPQLNTVGNYSFQLRVTDDIGQESDRTFSFTVAPLPSGNDLSIVWHSDPAVLPKGQEGNSYGLTLQGAGGVSPYSFSMSPTSTDVPAGMALNAFGALSGTPVGNTEGTYTFSIRIQDAIGAVSDRTFTLEILSAETDPNANNNVEPVTGKISNNGGCALSTGTTTTLALALLLLAMLAFVARRRQEA